MDERVIRSKLDSLARCLLHIEEDCPASAEDLQDDYRLQNNIVLELQRSVQTCVDVGMHILSEKNLPVPGTMKETFDSLGRLKIIDAKTVEALKGAVGFRNVAVHAYDEIDYAIVFSICTKHLDDFRAFAREIMAVTGEANHEENGI